jgi:hypothetical protein
MTVFRVTDCRWTKYLTFLMVDHREGESEADLTARCMETDPFPGAPLLNGFTTDLVAHYVDLSTAKVVRNDDGEHEWKLDFYANVKAILAKDIEAEDEVEARDKFDLELTIFLPAFGDENPGMWMHEWDPELEEGQCITCTALDNEFIPRQTV